MQTSLGCRCHKPPEPRIPGDTPAVALTTRRRISIDLSAASTRGAAGVLREAGQVVASQDGTSVADGAGRGMANERLATEVPRIANLGRSGLAISVSITGANAVVANADPAQPWAAAGRHAAQGDLAAAMLVSAPSGTGGSMRP